MSEMTGALKLARWVHSLRYEDLPPEVLFHAKRCMLDTLGVQVRGATLPWILPVYEYVRSMGASGPSTVSYYGDRLPAPYAAYANSAFSYSCELQHHGSPESAHPGVIVIPTVQALAEQLGSSGKDVVTAMVAGYEVQGALGTDMFKPAFSIYFSGKTRHFHTQGILGVFSAAAAAGKLLGLSELQLAHAFAIAGSHASGVLEYDQSGGEVKRIHGAIGARSGMQAALLAKAGLTGPLTIFEGHHGFFAAFGGASTDAAELFNDLGHPHCITRCRYRVYPTIGTQHNSIDVFDDLVRKHGFGHRDVERIRVGIRERGIPHVTTVRRPHDVISAQASLGYSLGVRLVKGSNSFDMYTDPEIWRDPDVLAIADKLEAYAHEDKQYPRMAKVEVTLKDGRVLRGEQGVARGSEGLPFTQEILDRKFRSLAEVVLPRKSVDGIMQTVGQLEALPSLDPLVSLLQKR